MLGVDYAWVSPKPDPACLKKNGVQFIMRYLSNDPAKDLTQVELNAALNEGLAVGVVWETIASRMLGGYNAGEADATEANNRVHALGIPTIPIYFACDFDATEADQVKINAYMDGVIHVIGKPRTGIYGGYYPVKRCFDAAKTTFGWQTNAWSGGQWDIRVQLQQSGSGTVCNTSIDWDYSRSTDFGQWPRPHTSETSDVLTYPNIPGNWTVGPFIVFDANKVIWAWGLGTNFLPYYTRSTDGGKTFSGPRLMVP